MNMQYLWQFFTLLLILIIFNDMQSMLFSRRQKEETSEKLERLSPDKYGRGAYLNLTFTPSKLSEHVLYREATNLKKIEEQSCKGRELEVANQMLVDQVEYLKKQRDGIEKSLNKMIDVYKQIIADMEAKNEERIRLMQLKFKEQIQRNIKDKEEEAKYIQSQKEMLEKFVLQLEAQIAKLKEELQYLSRNKNEVQADFDQLKFQHQTLTKNHEELEKRSKQEEARLKQELDQQKEKFLNAEVEWKDKFREEIHKKDLDIEKNARIHKAELQKIENQRNADTLLKNQQVKQLTKTFQTQTYRLKEVLNSKEKAIQNQAQEINREKTKTASLTREYEAQITHLAHEKNRLIEQIEVFSRQNQQLTHQKVVMTQELATENDKLRELLYESSMELEKCRSELIALAKDNQKLVTRVKGSEQQAKTWRDSYYLNRTRPG